MLCKVEQADYRSDTNAPAPNPLSVNFREYENGASVCQAALASEIALAITYNGLSQAVMMVSPGNLEDFIRGFSVSNDIVRDPREIYDLRLTHFDHAVQADVQISSRAFWALKNHRRQMAGTSGCGLCGVQALEQALPKLEILEPVALPPAEHFIDIRHRIEQAQQIARSSGALQHAGIDSRCGFTVVTSRRSLELIHKAVRARLGTLVSLSAPTALTVQWALKHRLNLIHVPHRNAPRIYSPA